MTNRTYIEFVRSLFAFISFCLAMMAKGAQDMHGNPIPLKKEDFAEDGQPTVYEFPGGIGSSPYMDFSRYALELGIRTGFTHGDIELVCSHTSFAEHMRWELICSGRR